MIQLLLNRNILYIKYIVNNLRLNPSLVLKLYAESKL